jgi:hypothetical protein
MVKKGTPARYMAMAPPERIEWVPMSSAGKPNTSSHILRVAACCLELRKAPVMRERLLLQTTVLTRLSSSDPG